MVKKLVCALLLVMICASGAEAQEDVVTQGGYNGRFREAGGESLADAVPGEERGYLDGIDPEKPGNLASSFSRLFENAADEGKSALRSAFAGLAGVAVVVITAAAARGISEAAGGGCDGLIDMAGALGCAAVLLRDFTNVLTLCRDTIGHISVFSGTLQPVLATVLCMGGGAATATVLQVSTMFVFDMVIRLVNGLLLPGGCAYLAVISVDAATGGEMLRGIGDGIKGLTSGVLKLILTLFTAYLAIAGGVSASVDNITLKTAKFAVSGAVPVVGGVISDATETMLSGAAVLRGSIGVFGMLCVTAICIVPFLRAGASYLCYKAGAAVLSPLCSGNLRRLLEGVGTGFGLLLGMLGACCMILYLELVYVVAMVKPV